MALEVVLISGAAITGSWLLAYMGMNVAQNVAKYFEFVHDFKNEKVNRSDLKFGDHIYIPGSQSQGLKIKGLVGYYHHGIYLGMIDGKEMVTDFGAVNKTRPVIREFDDFLGDYSNQLYRRIYNFQSKTFPPEKTLEYAKLICYGDKPWEPYNLSTNNCEHYASVLKMAQVYSAQATHLPQEFVYRTFIAPKGPKATSILKLHSGEN